MKGVCRDASYDPLLCHGEIMRHGARGTARVKKMRFPMSLTQFSVDDGPHSMDGLRLFARDNTEQVEAFIGRKVLDVWAESIEHRGGRQSLFRDQYNALGKLNLEALQRIVSAKYQRGAATNRQHPFIEVLFSDIEESGEILDLSELTRHTLPPAFHRLI
jgi:hypothetical protein